MRSSLIVPVVMFLLVAPGLRAASAVEPDLSPPSEATEPRLEADLPGAPVHADHRVLFMVRGSASLSAATRAAAIEERIARAFSDQAVTPETIRVLATPMADDIMAGETRIMRVLPMDGEFEGAPYHTVSEFHASRLRSALITYRNERTPERLTRGLGVSLAATGLLAVITWLLSLLFRRLDGVLLRHRRPSTTRAEEAATADSDLVLLRPDVRALHVLRWIILLVLLFFWLRTVLAQFPSTRWLSDSLGQVVTSAVGSISEGLVDYLPKLVFLLMLFLVTRYALRLLRYYFSTLERGSTKLPNFEPEWSSPTYKLVRAAVLGIALVMSYPYLPGAGTDALRGVSLFVGLLISLGASTAVSGAIAGYINTFGRVFKVGDVIKVGEVLGVVRQTRLLTTKIHTVRNEEVTIPNATITNTSLINYSTLAREGGLILQIEVGVGYGVPWRQVHAMLLEAAGRTPDLLPAPPPFVLQRELGTFAVSYVLNVRTARPDRMLLIRSVLHQNILDQFNEHGVQIMTPAYESDPRDLKVVPKERWFDAPASGS